MKQIIDIVQYAKKAGADLISGTWTFRSSTPDAAALIADVSTSGTTSSIQEWRVNGSVVAQMQQVFGFVPGIVANTGGLFFFGEGSNYVLINGISGLNELVSSTGWQVSSGVFRIQQQLLIAGGTTFAHQIAGTPTADRILTLPDKAGTVQVRTSADNPSNNSGWFTRTNVPASATNSGMGPSNYASSTFRYVFFRDGKLHGLSWSITEAITAGSLTLHVYKGTTKQTPGTYDTTITSASSTVGYKDFSGNEISFTAGDSLDFRFTTDGTFAPTTTDLGVIGHISYD